MDNENKNEKEIEQNNEIQEDIVEETTEPVEVEENIKEEVVKQENDVQESIEEEVEKEENSVKNGNNEVAETENVEETELEENTHTKTKRINLWLLLITLVLVILVLIYIFTDLLKTDEQNFAKYMYITSKNIENLKSDELEKYFDKTKYTSDGEISLTTNGEEAKVQFNGKTDVENRLKETNIITDYDKEELEINYKQDNDIYAIKINELYNKYIAIENNNLKELVNSLGLNSNKIPNRINLEEYKFTEKELVDIKQRYTKIIKNEINKENYSKEKIDNNNIYKLRLTNKQLNNVKIKVLQELKNDNLILEKYVIYEQMNGNKIEKEDLPKEIDSKIKDLEENVSEQEKEDLLICLYTKLNKCEKVEINYLEKTIILEMDFISLKILSQKQEENQEDNEYSFEIQKEEFAQELNYNIKIANQNYNFVINLKYSNLTKNTVKEDYDVDFKIENDNINLNYTNTTSQDNKLIINKLEESECEILNNLNKNEINELIYKIYNNLVSL